MPETSLKNEGIAFLHHSTGMYIWDGNTNDLSFKIAQVKNKITGSGNHNPKMLRLFRSYNRKHKTNYSIDEIIFPNKEPYGWNNNPFDYYNIWVLHAGKNEYMTEPTLEILTSQYDVIIFKHCFPVSNIQPDEDSSFAGSEIRTLGNYKLQYAALREKMHEFPDKKFILWTTPVKVKQDISEAEALLTREFNEWIRNEWDMPEDNIFLWDFYSLETEGELYLKPEYATGTIDSHPNKKFSGKACKLLFNRIIDVIENNGGNTSLDGHFI